MAKNYSPSWIWVIQQTLHTRQDRSDIISRTPSILQDIQTEFSVRVDVWMKHVRDKAYSGRSGGVRVGECEGKAERSIFERCLGWSSA